MGFGISKRQILKNEQTGEYFFGSYNDSNKHNSSHKVTIPTNFNLPSITLEDIDQGVFQEFNNRFIVDGKQMPLFNGDAETTSLPFMNEEKFDHQKGFLAWPFFVFTRTSTNKMFRTSPAFKQVLYAVPKKKAQGIVIEEYISTGPINYELEYEFKFITYFREECNNMEEQMNAYFKNKRNVFVVCNERFSIGPVNKDKIGSIEMIGRDEASQITMYVITFNLKVWAWTRDMQDMQKRERPNSYTLTFAVKDKIGDDCIRTTDVIQLEQFTIDNNTDPNTLINPT